MAYYRISVSSKYISNEATIYVASYQLYDCYMCLPNTTANVTGPARIGHIYTKTLSYCLTSTYNIFWSTKVIIIKLSFPIHKSTRKQAKFTEHDILSTDQEKYHFLNMCNLCRYAWFLQAQSQMRNYVTTSMHKIKHPVLDCY